MTHRRLDLYHEIALGQAARSFRNAQVAMVIGFLLLGGFVVVALHASTTAGSVVAGGLGAVAAALAGYVSRTFIRSQEAAAGRLRAYFHQPLEFSRYLAAERLVADAALGEERRAEVLGRLVEADGLGAGLKGPGEPRTGTGKGRPRRRGAPLTRVRVTTPVRRSLTAAPACAPGRAWRTPRSPCRPRCG
ncbi:hypothetical protein AB0950_06100 [Streptomyces sp. NPDC007189]|uniref:hypothetical protein n=1 Tax=Streptomyces sp. NPDC007189 TaxID=3154315 RepID=UPI0034542248